MRFIVSALVLLIAIPLQAAPVQIEIRGEVEFNGISNGPFAAVGSGAPVTITFTAETDGYIDSTMFPVRAYRIVPSSFVFTAGGASAGILEPEPTGGTYFAIRDNDPAVDGFVLTPAVDFSFPPPITLDEPGRLDPYFGLRWNVTYGGSTLSTLGLFDALGFYDFTGLTVFGFAMVDRGFDAMGILFVDLTISSAVSTESTSWGGVKALYQD